VPSYTATDWREIRRLYELLLEIAPSPAAQLGRVVAIAETGDLTSALALLDDVPRSPRRHAIRGELLARQHRYAEAVKELDDALGTAPANHPERAHRERRRELFRQHAGEPRTG
jgi:RNA polymerase sigma-70 factor (ECF subfamily)